MMPNLDHDIDLTQNPDCLTNPDGLNDLQDE